MKPAMLFEQIEDKKVRCRLCHHGCRISDQKFGLCNVRQNRDGQLYTLAYGMVIAAHIDPIEKNRCIIFCRAVLPTPSVRQAAILPAVSVRTGRFLKL